MSERISAMRDLTLLSYLVASAEAGNFGRAAQLAGVQTSTISRGVSRVEDELGVTVFERGPYGIRLTAAGKSVLAQVRRILLDVQTLRKVGQCSGRGHIGDLRLGIRMPPIGSPLQSLLSAWRVTHDEVNFILHELSEREIMSALERRDLDAAFLPRHAIWPGMASQSIYSEKMLVALPRDHRLLKRKEIGWLDIREEAVLVQGWDDSQTAREFYSKFLGSGVDFRSHAVSKQSILALVGAKFGVTLVTASQAEVQFPNVSYRPIAESNAEVQVDLVWSEQNEAAAVGRFIAFMRDESRLRGLR